MEAVRERMLDVVGERGADPVLHEMVLRHELQHTETMLQAMRLGGVVHPALGDLDPVAGDGLDLIPIAGGAYEIGAAADGFAYDNERPRHVVELQSYPIARTPVTNATWLSFTEGGGYERREWRSDEGWAWKQDEDITQCPAAYTGADAAPVCHISWFEADAFARAQGLMLPTEAEWETAVCQPHGDLGAVASVWEWTASEFSGYPGLVADPYRQYSEVLFDRAFRVLRARPR